MTKSQKKNMLLREGSIQSPSVLLTSLDMKNLPCQAQGAKLRKIQPRPLGAHTLLRRHLIINLAGVLPDKQDCQDDMILGTTQENLQVAGF